MLRSNYVQNLRSICVGFWFVIVRYFVLLYNYVNLGLKKYKLLIKSDIRLFFCTFQLRVEITLQFYCVLVYQFTKSLSTSELHYECFSYNDINFMTLGSRFCMVRLHNVWNVTFELRMEITLQLRFVFVRHCGVTFITSRLQFLLRHIYVIYLFDAVTFFDDVRITL